MSDVSDSEIEALLAEPKCPWFESLTTAVEHAACRLVLALRTGGAACFRIRSNQPWTPTSAGLAALANEDAIRRALREMRYAVFAGDLLLDESTRG